jgi:O-antigen ligase
MMNKKKLSGFLAFLSLAMLAFVVMIHIRFILLPALFLALGLSSYLWNGRKALLLFLFLLPLINSTPDIFFNGYPYNYMAVALFYLSGIWIASLLKKEKPEFAFPAQGAYLFFLTLLSVSVFFVFLRWSNLTLSSLAFLRDTPVTPSGERLSFACIFPVVTLALFSLAPFLASAIRHWDLKENEIFIPLKAGFCLSFLLALAQKWLDHDLLAQSWWELNNHQVNGGFSDFNAFGFFAGVMFLYQALRLTEKMSGRKAVPVAERAESTPGAPPSTGIGAWGFEMIFLMIALAAIYISGCRTAFLFVLLAVIVLVFSRKTSFLAKALFLLLLAVSLLVAGGTLKKRLRQSLVQTVNLSGATDKLGAVDALGSGRLAMVRDSAQMIGRFPVSGVGAGNFLFYLKYLHFNEPAYLDLPLNQYLLMASETGLVGGLAFILFLAVLLKRQKKGARRLVTAAIAFALFFNNFFWFPECLLLFWIFLSGNDWPHAPDRRLKPAWLYAIAVLFIVFQALDFRALHPENLTREKGVAYDYGFWPHERDGRGAFSWTSRAAGKYFTAADARDFSILCAAPQRWLRKKSMAVELYWRGELFQRTVFFENGSAQFRLPGLQEGFLEIRVHPTFNLHALRLGADARELGVRFMAATTARP